MIIGEPRVAIAGQAVRIEAAIKLQDCGTARPTTLFFEVPGAYHRYVTSRADPFAVALLPLAMHLGEDLQIEGELSSRLAAGMREYQRVQAAWKPRLFKEVEVSCGRLVERRREACEGAVGAAFSGGVDSFYTLWTHLAANEPYPPFRLTHCLMINGFDFDTDLSDTGHFLGLQRLYEPMMARLGLELVVVRTNLRQFLGKDAYGQSFAAFLTAAALAFGRLFSRFFIPAGAKVTAMGMYPDGSHLMLDHLLATETIETIHDAAHVSRLEKVLLLANWPETYDRLRVCIQRTGVRREGSAVANCGRCEKCIRTMVTLEVAGALPRYECFPQPLSRRVTRKVDLRSSACDFFTPEIVEFARREKRPDIARDLRHAVRRSRWFWRPVTEIVHASYRLQQRSRRYAAIVIPAKRILRWIGWGRGWLY
jgi:hypothetical protein